MYVLKEADDNFAEAIIPFATHADEKMRQQTFYLLNLAPDKSRYIDVFLDGLQDESTNVVGAALHALRGVTDERLLSAYRRVAERYPTEEGHIRVNLQHRLREHGFEILEAFERGDPPNLKARLKNTFRSIFRLAKQ